MSEGASITEQLIEAARRNNTDLLHQVLFETLDSDQARIARAINSARDSLGNSPLHMAAQNGSYEVLDLILDQEGVEVDPINLLQGESPLHCVVRYARDEPEYGAYLAEMLVEAGCDPRIKNKHGQKPIDIADPSNTELCNQLQGAEYAHMYGADVATAAGDVVPGPQGEDVDDESNSGDSGDETDLPSSSYSTPPSRPSEAAPAAPGVPPPPPPSAAPPPPSAAAPPPPSAA